MIKTVHCIYQHSNPTTGEIFYIGLGTKDRPYSFNTGRSKEWQEYINVNGKPKVTILHDGLTVEEADRIERELVSRLKKNDVYMKSEEQKIGKILNEICQFKYYRLPSDLNVGILSVIDIGEKYEFRNKVQHYKIRGSFSVSTKWFADGHTQKFQLPFV